MAGEVYEPGSFRFEPGLAFTDYLELAAGITKRARKKDIYVIEPNGAVVSVENSKRQLFRFDRSVAGLSPGSVIVVPTNYDYEKPLDRYRGITLCSVRVAGLGCGFLLNCKQVRRVRS